MSVSVSMPQLGESVTEGTVTRWLKREGERVEADEPLLEVSTDKVDTEIPSPVSGILRGITVAEDETVAVGAELAVIDDDGSGGGAAGASGGQAAGAAADEATAAPADEATAAPATAPAGQDAASSAPPSAGPGPGQDGQSADEADEQQAYREQPYPQPAEQQPYPQPSYQQQADQQSDQQQSDQQQSDQQQSDQQQSDQQPYQPPYAQQPPGYPQPYQPPYPQQPPAYEREPGLPRQQAPAGSPQAYQTPPAYQPAGDQSAASQPSGGLQEQAQAGSADFDAQGGPDGGEQAGDTSPSFAGPEGPYVTPLVRKLASEHGIDLAAVTGTGVGGRIRKQDVLDAANARRGQAAGYAQQPAAQHPAAQQPVGPQRPAAGPSAAGPPAAPQAAAPQFAAPQFAPAPGPAAAPQAAPGRPPAAAGPDQPESRPGIVPSRLRGTTEKMSRSRQVIAQRMVESLQTSAQLTTVVEADVTAIARLRERAKAAFEAREGVKLSFLPFFALAAVEALKEHPKLNAVIDAASAQVTYHDAEHLGIAVDTERGLMVPVIRKAGDLNIAGLARKIADLANRTRAGQVSPDELSGGTFTLTNTGSRGALFDTPIINQPQVAILGTGIVVKRPVVVEDPALGEVITVRSMVYLALTYDHRLVDGADAARFLATMKSRLEEGAFETGLGL